MIMAVSKTSILTESQGQSLLEFVVMLPILMVVFGLVYKANILSLISINNQKYVRAQTLFLAFNSPYFPERRFDREFTSGGVFYDDVTLLELGMSERVISTDIGQTIPTEVKYPLLRSGQDEFANGAIAEGPNKITGTPVVRSNVAICTQPRFILGTSNPLSLMDFKTQEYPVNICRGHQE